MMLVLSRYPNEELILRTSAGEVIRVVITKVDGPKVRIGVDAPRSVTVDRKEIDEVKRKQGGN